MYIYKKLSMERKAKVCVFWEAYNGRHQHRNVDFELCQLRPFSIKLLNIILWYRYIYRLSHDRNMN